MRKSEFENAKKAIHQSRLLREPLNIISLGAGVQSSTMCLMAARGEITPMPDCAIFADTQAEPRAVYEWLAWLTAQLPFPVHIVTAGNLMEDELRVRRSSRTAELYSKNSIPAYVKKPDGTSGILGRKCTTDYKIMPIVRKVMELVKIKRSVETVRAIMWIGISRDEIHRMKPSRFSYIRNIWPLVDMRVRRGACLEWMQKNGFPVPPRSACTFCPFHSDSEWRNLKQSSPSEFNDAVRFERRLMETTKIDGVPYLHSSLVPLDEVDLRDSPSHGQLDLFGNECEGLCGV